MTLALYRTYRPGSLSEVIGQDHVTEPLARALEAGRIHHAYLFSGPRGCGKTSTARILARSLNCEQGPTAFPCGTCRSCQELAPNGPGSIDVVELDAATHRGIDDARELREKAIYAPAASRYKIYIIDEAHQLTNEAANALLKLVEEPPAHLRFVFATTEPDRIIPTIRSRTFHYGFRLVPSRVLIEHLARVCRAEDVAADEAALAVVARAGAGSVRDSLSVLGQLIAGVGDEGLTYATAVSALGLTDASLIDGFVAATTRGSAAEMFTLVDEVVSAGHDPRRFVADLLDRLRDLIILRADPAAAGRGVIDVPDDAMERLVEQAGSLSLVELSRAADLVSAGLSEIKGATAPRLQLELLCARLALPPADLDPAALAVRLDRVERVLGSGHPPAMAAGTDPDDVVPRPAPGAGPAPSPGSVPGPGSVLGQETGAPAVGLVRGGAGPSVPAPGSAGPPRRPTLRTAGASPTSTDPVPAPSPRESPGAAPAAASDQVPSPPGPPPTTAAPAHGGAASERAASERDAPARDVPERAVPERAVPAQGVPDQSTDLGATPQPSPPAPAARAAGTPGGAQLDRVRGSWPAILDRLAAGSRVAWTAFHSATPVSISEGVLAVALSEAGNIRAIAQRGHDERLRQAIIDVVALDLSIDVVHNPDAARGERATAAARPAAPTGAPPAGAGGTPAEGSAPAGRGARDVREAGHRGMSQPDVPDEPSVDDPDLAAADGLALITRELGARPIEQIDHT